MGSTAQNGHGTAAARLLGLLAVLLGLLAMHGLAGTHHAAAAVPGRPAVAHVVHSGPATPSAHGPAVQVVAADHDAGASTAHVTVGTAAAVTVLPGPACDGDCRPDAAVLCLAVLVGASAAALLAAATRRCAGAHLPARPSTAGPPSPRRAPPATPDPVKDLCVSRT